MNLTVAGSNMLLLLDINHYIFLYFKPTSVYAGKKKAKEVKQNQSILNHIRTMCTAKRNTASILKPGVGLIKCS